MNNKLLKSTMLLLCMAALSACESPRTWFGLDTKAQHHHEVDPKSGSEAVMASEAVNGTVVDLIGIRGSSIGKAQLSEVEGGVRIQLEAASLPPGTHGFHVHETGACTPPDFASAGAHLNPAGRKHGLENPAGPHAGDLPNLVVGADGKVTLDVVARQVTLAKDKSNSLLKPGGTSLVIHEKADDYKTDPSGNSGARIACGVVK